MKSIPHRTSDLFQVPRSLWKRLCLFLIALSPTAALASAPTAYVESASVKIQPAHALPQAPNKTISISAARNEFEPFQIAIHGGSDGLRNVSASISELRGPQGALIPARNLWLYRVDLLNVTTASGSIGARGVWPDPLVPARDETLEESRRAFPFDVGADVTRAIWGEVLVPRDVPAGDYTGTIWIEGDGFSAELPIALTVYGFTLPSTPTMTTAFLAWLPNICQAHTGDAGCGGWATAATLARRYAEFALDHRITLSNVWVGQDHTQDWSGFDATFGPLLDGTANTRLSGARMTTAQITGQRTVEKFRSWAQHFRDKGWFSRLYDYTADEPPYGATFEEIPGRVQLAKEADGELDVLVTTNHVDTTNHGLLDLLDIIVPLVNHIDTPEGGNQRSAYDGFIEGGGRLWLYQSCMSHGCSFGGPTPGVNWPSYMVDVSAAKNRLMQWTIWRNRISGELYYETALAFSANPWSSVFEYSGNGDGTLFYPGTPARIGGEGHVPVASIRLKMIREGIEDFEYLHLLDTLGARDFAESVVAEVMPTAYSAHDDAGLIEAARRQLAEKIVALSGGSDPGDGDAGFPGDEDAAMGCTCTPTPPTPEPTPEGGETCATCGTDCATHECPTCPKDGNGVTSCSGCSLDSKGSRRISLGTGLLLVLIAMGWFSRRRRRRDRQSSRES
ncbi:MAG: DUF4091 domain-containing protein [Myxococcales bacterium]|jgi:hypothetical protein|nr:DUF4091 domain-containing protein [Myxococcales bacterium]